jgi:hypothetical protein
MPGAGSSTRESARSASGPRSGRQMNVRRDVTAGLRIWNVTIAASPTTSTRKSSGTRCVGVFCCVTKLRKISTTAAFPSARSARVAGTNAVMLSAKYDDIASRSTAFSALMKPLIAARTSASELE